MTSLHTSLGIICISALSIGACKQRMGNSVTEVSPPPDVQIAGAMRNVMWKGELQGIIGMDSIASKESYGLGPLSFLRGEIMVYEGKSYVSRVNEDSSMQVEENTGVSAPFFVYTQVKEWEQISLPQEIKTPGELERYLDERTKNHKRPFAFRLEGRVHSANIHVQNLAPGSKVSSPEEAHRGQVNYELPASEVSILGFFSTEHKGVFTHHDTWLHMHLLTKDLQNMGHVDEVLFDQLTLYLPLR